ncbi:MAG TPA: tRNA lysidine(34) synthetase TilS [Ktedonobacteraceae bacterium]|nr:tRNA lysidine(34) synthetase TilS [Ktedonobacteraceae bacterium]
MLESIAAFIDQYALFPPGGKVIVAVSGGADSLCLLHLLNQLCGSGKRYAAIQLRAAHLNHQLRGAASEQDAAAVAGIASAWGLPFTTGTIDVPALARSQHRSIEDAARLARYRFLREVAQGQPIAVAHHTDDQVETLLLHYLRGSGLSGMVGMQPRQGDIIRPLLGVTHAQTVAYCQQHGIEPLEDASNADPAYTRNRIRHQLLPLMESINPGFRATLLRSAAVMRSDLDYIEAQLDACWPGVISSEQEDAITLQLEKLAALPANLQRHLVRRVTSHLCGGQSPLEPRHYALIEQLLQAPADRQTRSLDLPQGLRVTRVLHKATFERLHTNDLVDGSDSGERDIRGREGGGHGGDGRDKSRPYNSGEEVELSVPGEVAVPGTAWIARAEILADGLQERVKEALRCEDWTEVWHLLPLSRYVVYIDAASAASVLRVRTRRPGDRLQPLGMQHEKKVQDVLVDKRIARPLRDSIPLFFSASHCVWLAGVALDERVRLTSQTERIVRICIIPA